LEELAILEEAAETEKVVNVASSKKLQSSGWSKGFFNKKKNSAATKPLVSSNHGVCIRPGGGPWETVRQQERQSQESRPVKPISTNVFSGVIQERQPSANRGEVSTSTKSKVSFVETHEVMEIPRIGETSVKSIIKPSKCRAFAPSTTSVPAAKGVNAVQQQDVQLPPKRLSRFATERQQRL
jgi:hypothetical protein